MKHKHIFCILFIILFLVSGNTNATYYADSDPRNELIVKEMPDSLEFSVNNTCSGHAYFNQAVAADNGYVAIYSDYIDYESFDIDTFQKAYVDIYDPEGHFVVEFSFKTKAGRSIGIWEDVVFVYLFDTAIAYNYINEEVSYYSFPENSEPYAYKTDVVKKFSAGEWEYECHRSFVHYTKLIRRNGNYEQVLVDLPGAKGHFWTRIVPASVIGIGGFIIFCIIFKFWKKRKKHRRLA